MVMGEQTSASTSPILELRGISKSFHGTKVLDGVDFAVRSGEVMALMGENGAGKSTLMKIVTGIYEADPGGTIKLDGTEVRFTSPGQSISAGIAMIHQDLNLLPGLTAAENLYLGREPLNGFGLIDWPTLREESRKHLAALQQSLDPGVRVGRLRVGQQQIVEIARALSLNARLIIMDEPTDALTDVETDILHDAIRRLRDQGKGIVYISHRLSEIFKICDSVTVLRDGQTAAAEPTAAVSEAELIHHMVGREITDKYPYTPAADRPVSLRVDHLSAPGIEDISFEAHEGAATILSSRRWAISPSAVMKRRNAVSVIFVSTEWILDQALGFAILGHEGDADADADAGRAQQQFPPFEFDRPGAHRKGPVKRSAEFGAARAHQSRVWLAESAA